MNTTLRFWADTAERMVRTFLQAYLGAWLAAPLLGSDTQWDTLFTTENLKYAVVTTLLALATAVGAKGINNKDSASVLPPEAQPPAPQPPEVTEPINPGLTDTEQLRVWLQQLQPLVAAPPPPPPVAPLAPAPVAQPIGLLDPNLVGGRNLLSEGNT